MKKALKVVIEGGRFSSYPAATRGIFWGRLSVRDAGNDDSVWIWFPIAGRAHTDRALVFYRGAIIEGSRVASAHGKELEKVCLVA